MSMLIQPLIEKELNDKRVKKKYNDLITPESGVFIILNRRWNILQFHRHSIFAKEYSRLYLYLLYSHIIIFLCCIL